MLQGRRVQEEQEVRVSINHLLCPITQEIMDDPVIASDGITYERRAITAWQLKSGATPIGREPITDVFIPNLTVRNLIDEYKFSMSSPRRVEIEVVGDEGVCAALYRDLLAKLGRRLSVANNELQCCSVVEQTLVALADVYTSQTGVSFCRENDGICFLLNFSNTAEYGRFILHYQSKYAGSILKQGEYQVAAPTKVVLDIKTFYEAIIPALGEYRKNHSLNNIMLSLSRILNVEYTEVYIGDIVERRLVAKAGISTSQKKAHYGRGADYCTIFNLEFTSNQEHTTFLSYYNQNYPNFIIRSDAYAEAALSRVEVSSNLLLTQIAPTLYGSLDPQKAKAGCNLL